MGTTSKDAKDKEYKTLRWDNLSKIIEILNNVRNKFLTVYTPKRELSLDEGIIPWLGTLSLRTYNPAKLVKYGILVRMVCEATSRYICNFKIYSGTAGRYSFIISRSLYEIQPVFS